MNFSSLFSGIWKYGWGAQKHVKVGDKLAPQVNYNKPSYLFSFDNPIEGSRSMDEINQYTSKDLYGGVGAKVFTYMIDNVPAISSCIENISSCIAEVKWKLEGDHIPKKTMSLFEELLDNIDFTNKIRDITTFVPYGWVAFEIIFDRPTKNLAFPIVDLSTIRQETLEHWTGDERGKVIGLKQIFNDKSIPVQKLVIFRDSPNRGCVEGRGMLRSCFSSFKILESLKSIHLELKRCSMSNFVKASVPMSILNKQSSDELYGDKGTQGSQESMRQMTKILEGISKSRATTYVIASDVQTVIVDGVEKPTSSRKFDIEVQPLSVRDDLLLEDIKYYNNEIIMGMLMENRLIGSGETGSKSSGEVHKTTLETFIASHCKTISSTMKSQLFNTFAALNGIKKEHIPDIVASDIDKSNINFKINASQAVIHASEKGFPEIARDIARDANLPEEDIKDEDEMELESESLVTSAEGADLNLQQPGQQIKQA